MRKLILRTAAALGLVLATTGSARAADDFVIWRPSNGNWYALTAASGFTANAASVQWGTPAAGDVPLIGDIDGDRIRDFVLWRGATGIWYTLTSSSGYNPASQKVVQWGNRSAGDVPLLADVDGDAKVDFTVWRASTGTFYWLTSSSGYTVAGSRQWGSSSLGDVPLAGDFDGDGRSDLAVWRASTGTWFWLTSSSNYAYASAGTRQWGSGAAGDVPKTADMDGDGRDDLIVWRAPLGVWFWLTSSSGYAPSASKMIQWGSGAQRDVPMVGKFDADGRADIAVWRPATGTWYALTTGTNFSYNSALTRTWGGAGDAPVTPQMFRGNGAAPVTGPVAPPTAPPPPVSGQSGVELRVLEWNTHHGGVGTDGVYNPDRLASWAASMRPDVILFNEIEKNNSWGNQDQPEVYKALLQQKTGRTWYYHFAQEFGAWSSNGKGNLILSTYPFTYTDRYLLARNGDRSIAMAGITVNGRPITLICTHLDPYDAALRLVQATEVTGWSAAQPQNRIIGGDMNAWPDQTSIGQFNATYNDSWAVAASSGTAVAFSGNTGQTKSGRIDYIFYSKASANLVVKASQVFDTRDASGVMPSDHRPVLTTFIVK